MAKALRFSLWVCAALGFLSCRNDSRGSGSQPERPAAVEDADTAARSSRPAGGRTPVIWIGLDGLDPDFMDRLSAEGKVPNWTKLVAEGASAKLASFVPMISPAVWTTIATGAGPDVHGVLDFQEIDPATGSRVPISGLSRSVPAVWNFASAAGAKVGVVGWWATYPAEVVDGFFVSDRASPILHESPVSAGVAYPPALDAMVGSIRARDGAVNARGSPALPRRASGRNLPRAFERPRQGRPGRRARADRGSDPHHAADRPGSVRPRTPGPARGVFRGDRRDRPRLRRGDAAAPSVRVRRRVPPGPPGGRDLLRRGRPHSRPVDAPRPRGRRDPDREFRPRLQMGERPDVRALLARVFDGGLLAPDRRRLRGVGGAGHPGPRRRSPERVRPRSDRARSARRSARRENDGKGDSRLSRSESASPRGDFGGSRRAPRRGGADPGRERRRVRGKAPIARVPVRGRHAFGGPFPLPGGGRAGPRARTTTSASTSGKSPATSPGPRGTFNAPSRCVPTIRRRFSTSPCCTGGRGRTTARETGFSARFRRDTRTPRAPSSAGPPSTVPPASRVRKRPCWSARPRRFPAARISPARSRNSGFGGRIAAARSTRSADSSRRRRSRRL